MLADGARSLSMPDDGPGVVAAGAYAKGHRVANIAIEEAGEWAHRPGHVVWIGLLEPDDDLLARVQRQFGLHDLAIEDARNAHQRPKLEQYGNGLFVVARTAQMIDGRVAFGETHLFVGKGYVVSVRHGASKTYSSVRGRCEANPNQLSHGEDFILYAILDFIVDNYMDVLEAMHEEVELIEDIVLSKALSAAEVERLYTLRRDLLRLRNAVVPLVDVCRRIENTEHLAVDDVMRHHFRDVTDHIRRVQEEIESLREVLAFAFEASLMGGQAQQTEVSRKLSAGAAILAVPTAIAGIYGMNFKNMPELESQYGYYIVLAVIISFCTLLFWRFRKNGWL
ncbi:MAG TPA: magnesium/cobalt transporter CorA [Beijerinckiaceae bacterium]|nr:magnesium/cobalt transporter CorA [Beijerinckiaceae bacterium]